LPSPTLETADGNPDVIADIVDGREDASEVEEWDGYAEGATV